MCVCVQACTLVCSRSGQIGPLLHDNRSISVLLAHLCLSFFAPVCLLSTPYGRKKCSHCSHPYTLFFSLPNPTANYLMLHTSRCFYFIFQDVFQLLFFFSHFYKTFYILKMVFSRTFCDTKMLSLESSTAYRARMAVSFGKMQLELQSLGVVIDNTVYKKIVTLLQQLCNL